VARVYYPGLPSHPQHALACQQQSGSGGIVSFEIRGGRNEAWRFIDAVRLFTITGNLGDTRSIITHPASTTHGRLSAADKEASGIREGLIRLSVGLEDLQDLQRDLAAAFDNCGAPGTSA